MMKGVILFILFWLLAFGLSPLQAQSEVIFQVNISNLISDQSFDPNRDRVEIIGNRSPLSATQPFELSADENNLNLFKATIPFPDSLSGTTLEYQFRVMINNRYRTEDMPRSLRIPYVNRTLNSIYFNSFTR